MSETLINLIDWTDSVNARSSKALKQYQMELANTINRSTSDMVGPTPMTISSPVRLNVITKGGTNTARHFIGGEEVHLSCCVITQRTYKVMLEFTPVAASDIGTIKIPLKEALSRISGLEIRMMATPVLPIAEKYHAVLFEEREAKQADKFNNEYSSIGYGSW